MIKNLENYSELNFNFEYKNRMIRSTFENNEYFKLDTPFLKVLKPIHVSTNKKKNLEKKYIILEINDDYNLNKELDDFLIIINKLHETSQENIRKNSIKWFNTEFDEFGLDLKVKKPIDKQKEKQFIKIIIPNDNEELLKKIQKLEKNNYVMTSIFYKGLKVSNDYLMGEYELINLITQEEYEEKKELEVKENDFNNRDFIENINNDEILDNNNIEDIVENIVEDIVVENNEENKTIEKNEEILDNINTNDITKNEIIDIPKKNKKGKKKNNDVENNKKFIKIVSRKSKSLIFI